MTATIRELNGNGMAHVADYAELGGLSIPGLGEDLLAAFGDLIDQFEGQIGRVVGSEKEPAGSHRFYFWAKDGALSLDIGHVVVAFSEEAAVIGVVDEPRRFSDLRSFLDDYFDRHLEDLIVEEVPTKRPEILVFAVDVLATRHLRDDVVSHRPPVGGPVFWATQAAIEYALGVEDFSGVPIPALLHTNGNPSYDDLGLPKEDAAGRVVFQRSPIWLDADYLLGPEAGHANWTGQSGLATKTSHALYLTSAVFQKMKSEGRSVAALMFNVKGPDLLWLDKPAEPDDDLREAYATQKWKGLRPEDHDAYAALGLEPRPFAPFRIFAPFKPGQVPGGKGSPVVRLDGKIPYTALNTLRTAADQAASVVYPILWQLDALLWTPHKVFEFGDLDDKFFGLIYDIREHGVASIEQLEKFFSTIDAYFEENPDRSEWQGHHKATILKAKNRFKGLPSKFGGLLADAMVEYGSLPKATDPFEDGELRVIDISQCNTNVQELIVSSVINSAWRLAEENKLKVEKLIVFVDELNKYAPGGGEGGLRDTLVDIAARGRHLNLVLFGAQQFRSKVDGEILGNCGTSFYGRVGDEEIVNAAYRSLTETAKAELLGLPKGRLLVRHAHFRSPLFGAFPLPPTIPGAIGQRVFNGEGDVATGHAADGIWTVLQKAMGDRVPRKHEVYSAAEGLDRSTLDEICAKVEAFVRQSAGRAGVDPWRFCALKLLDTERRRQGIGR
jgi:uncharacterized protein